MGFSGLCGIRLFSLSHEICMLPCNLSKTDVSTDFKTRAHNLKKPLAICFGASNTKTKTSHCSEMTPISMNWTCQLPTSQMSLGVKMPVRLTKHIRAAFTALTGLEPSQKPAYFAQSPSINSSLQTFFIFPNRIYFRHIWRHCASSWFH